MEKEINVKISEKSEVITPEEKVFIFSLFYKSFLKKKMFIKFGINVLRVNGIDKEICFLKEVINDKSY